MTAGARTRNVWIDSGCIACGLCESLVPEVFRVPAGATSQVQPLWRLWAETCPESEERVRGARDSCPVDVIRLGGA
jgi:ferredoxin